MSADHIDEQIAHLNRLSEGIFGEAVEVDAAEAEELLRTAGIDPEEFKNRLYQRMLERSKNYSDAGEPIPRLMQKALEDLEPSADRKIEETAASRTARLGIARLLREIRELPKQWNAGLVPVFTAAYRNRRELSTRDQKVLDGIADDLRRKAQE